MNLSPQTATQSGASPKGGKRILVVEDDADISHLLEIHLRDHAYRVDVAGDGLQGLELAGSRDYQLILLDRMLPGLDGLEVCKRLRAQGVTVPILMLTAKTTEFDRVLGLELGADDYITKPFSIMELQARIKAVLRRVEISSQTANAADTDCLEIEGLRIDVCARQVSVDERSLDLTAKEFDLLLYFARHPGRVYSRAQLLDQVWGYSHSGYEHTVNTHINRLRKKIDAASGALQYIETVWGVGYRFREPVSA